MNCPVVDFLMKAPDPPPALIVRNAIQMLKVSIGTDLDGIVFASVLLVWQHLLLSFVFLETV